MKSANSFFQFGVQHSIICLNMIIGLSIIASMIVFINTICKSQIKNYITGLITATHPSLIDFSCHILRENIFLFFCSLVFISILLFIKEEKIKYILFSGTFTAFALLTRIEGFELFLGVLLLLLFCQTDNIKRILYICVFVGIFFISIITILILLDVSPNYIIAKFFRIY